MYDMDDAGDVADVVDVADIVDIGDRNLWSLDRSDCAGLSAILFINSEVSLFF